MKPVRGIETNIVYVESLMFETFKLMKPVRGIETYERRGERFSYVGAFKLMKPVRGIETRLNLPRTFVAILSN